MKTVRFTDFIAHNVFPFKAKKIGVYGKYNKRFGGFELDSKLFPETGRKLYSFGVLSDVHLQSNTAKADFKRALQYFSNNDDISFVCINGDLTSSGYGYELEEYRTYVEQFCTKPVYAITGNHETYGTAHDPNTYGGLSLVEAIQQYTGMPFYYTVNPDGTDDVFIMVGIQSEGYLFTDDEIIWLKRVLEENRNKRCFVFQHVFPGKTTTPVCGNAYGLYHNYCWSEPTQTKMFEDLMKHYKNVIWFHGHSHFKFDMQSRDCTYANIDNSDGYWSVHVPSIAIPRTYDVTGDGKPDYLEEGSEGYIVDVYERGVHLRGRDFMKEEFLAIASYWLDTTPVHIPAKDTND